MSGILRLESLTKGNTLKQGDKTPLKYRLFDADGEKLNIAGKSAQVRLVYPDFLTIGYEKDGLTVAQDDTVTFMIDKVIPAKLYHVEIIVDDQFIFPSRADEAKFTIDNSSLGTETNIIEIVGVDAVVRKAVDLINDDPSLIIDEDKLVTDIISNTGIGSIEEYYQQFTDVIKELSEDKDYHSLPEIAGARGGHETLGNRLDELSSVKANISEVYSLEKSLENVIQSADLDPNKDQELVDGRGKYDTLGTRLRSLDTYLEKIKEVSEISEINLHDGTILDGYVRDTDGSFRYMTTRRATNYIPIDGERVVYTTKMITTEPHTTANRVLFYDEDKNYIGHQDFSTERIVPLAGSKYIRQTLVVNMNEEQFYPERYIVWQDYESLTTRSINKISNAIKVKVQPVNLFTGNAINEVVSLVNGEAVHIGVSNSYSTDYIKIDSSKPLRSNRRDLGETRDTGFVFYDASKNFIGSVSTLRAVGDWYVNPLPNSHYVRETISTDAVPISVDKYILWQEANYISDEIKTLEEKVALLEAEIGLDLMNKQMIYVNDFYDSSKTDSEIISDCLSFTSIMPERVIVFDTKNWNIDEAILLPSNTIVIVDGVMIKQNNGVFDNVFRGDNLEIDPENPYHYPLSISPINHIYIYGINGAKIEGPDANKRGVHPTLGEQDMTGDFWGWRTLQISLSKCENFEISGFRLDKTRCWSMSFDKCSHFKVHDIEVNSNVKNGDGVNVRFGCHNFEVYNITGSTSDDSVAINTIDYFPSGSYVYPMEPSAFENDSLPSEDLHIYDGYIEKVHTTGQHHAVICLANSGRKIFNVSINDIKEPTPSNRESMVKIYSGYGSGYNANDISRIRVNNVLSKGATHAVQITHKVDDVWVNKVTQDRPDGNVSTIANMDGVTITNS